MALINLTYISESLIPVRERGAEIAALAAHAETANHRTGIAGALMFTGTHFAQTLEGSAAAVDATMARIVADTRHHLLLIVDRQSVCAPRFDRWSMAYSGTSLFVAKAVDSARAGNRRDIDQLIELVRAFSAAAMYPAVP